MDHPDAVSDDETGLWDHPRDEVIFIGHEFVGERVAILELAHTRLQRGETGLSAAWSSGTCAGITQLVASCGSAADSAEAAAAAASWADDGVFDVVPYFERFGHDGIGGMVHDEGHQSLVTSGSSAATTALGASCVAPTSTSTVTSGRASCSVTAPNPLEACDEPARTESHRCPDGLRPC
jgi:hypothetical protein